MRNFMTEGICPWKNDDRGNVHEKIYDCGDAHEKNIGPRWYVHGKIYAYEKKNTEVSTSVQYSPA